MMLTDTVYELDGIEIKVTIMSDVNFDGLYTAIMDNEEGTSIRVLFISDTKRSYTKHFEETLEEATELAEKLNHQRTPYYKWAQRKTANA